MLSRFNSFPKFVTVSAGMVWSFFVVAYAEYHTKTVCIGVSVFFLSSKDMRAPFYSEKIYHSALSAFATPRETFQSLSFLLSQQTNRLFPSLHQLRAHFGQLTPLPLRERNVGGELLATESVPSVD